MHRLPTGHQRAAPDRRRCHRARRARCDMALSHRGTMTALATIHQLRLEGFASVRAAAQILMNGATLRRAQGMLRALADRCDLNLYANCYSSRVLNKYHLPAVTRA